MIRMKKKQWIFVLVLVLVLTMLFYRYGLPFIHRNKYAKVKTQYEFTEIINLGCTSVKQQGASNTCWSYTGNSFLESEMIRMGKKPVEISQIYTARQAYLGRAQNFVRLHGGLSMGEGGQLQDVLNVFRKYGALPQSAYSGLYGNNTYNDFKKMTPMLNSLLKVLVKTKPLRSNWEESYQAALDAHLGKVPETFDYEGKKYTARTFADQVIGIRPNDYVALASVTDQPFYEPFVLLVPDNWSFDSFYNVPMEQLTNIIDTALKRGFTVAWTTDVSENGFSWQHGLAYVPQKSENEMSKEEINTMFVKPMPERKITADERQAAFENWQTTDDHAMHIVGLANDQYGRPYYIVKNSWGKANPYKGYMYVTKEFVRFKTISLLLHKDALEAKIKTKITL